MRAGDPLHGAASRGHCALLSAAAERRCEDCPASGFEESVSRGSSESEVSEIRWAAGSGGFEVRLQLGVCMVSPRPLAPLCAQTAGECSLRCLRRESQVNEKWGGRGGWRERGGGGAARAEGGGGKTESNGEAAGWVKWERVGGLELRVLPCDSRHVWPLPGREGATCPPSPGFIT